MKPVSMIGLKPAEIPWMRLVVALLRHSDPVVREVACEAFRYLEAMAARADENRAAG